MSDRERIWRERAERELAEEGKMSDWTFRREFGYGWSYYHEEYDGPESRGTSGASRTFCRGVADILEMNEERNSSPEG